MQPDIVDKFTTHLKNVLTRTLCLVIENKEDQIHPKHLLWALGTQKGCIGAEILHKLQIKPERLRSLVGATVSSGTNTIETDVSPLLSDNAKRAIEKAVLVANVYEHHYIGTEHLLAGLLQIRDKAVTQFLGKEKIDPKVINEHLTTVLKGTSKFPDFAESINTAEELAMPLSPEGNIILEEKTKTPALDFFARDLTSADIQENIDPVIARDNEIQRVMEILCRRTKNNPVLLGEPGVGKTAIVEGLAKRILNGDVPPVLQRKRILAVDMASIIAGTMYRGEFEERLRQVIEEVRNDPNTIIFIDEVHTIIGVGASTGSLDAANILKPALARGEIRCIGATTPTEFKKNIEADAALERRFQSVIVKEPSQEVTQEILSGIAENYERFHNVGINQEAITSAVELSTRYLQDKYLPDKAIDLIDEAAAAHRVAHTGSDTNQRVIDLEQELHQIQQTKRHAVVEERFKDASKAKEQEVKLQEQIVNLKESQGEVALIGTVSKDDIAKVVARSTGIPVEDLIDQDAKRLVKLEQALSVHVLGQDKVIKTVADAIRRAKTGIHEPNRPLASFLFLGPSGVGKTELAKTLAKEVFQEAEALVLLDMSEYSEGYTVSKLVGSPAGYVGYREGTKLTDQVKQQPYSVVLFDELEKAHPDVQNLLLQILENGELSDATGRKINFKNTLVVMTSNIGLEKYGQTHLGFASSDDQLQLLDDDVRTELEERLRPELLNRIDHICLFETLSESTLKAITVKQLNELSQRLSKNGVKIVYNDKVVNHIVNSAKEDKVGARAIRRVIGSEIEPKIAGRLLTRSGINKVQIILTKQGLDVRASK